MRYSLLIFMLPLFLFACQDKPKNKKYYVYISTKEYYPSMGKRMTGSKIDSVLTTTDSAAYQDAVFRFTAMKLTEKIFEEKGAMPPTIAEDFKVFDDLGENIRYKLNSGLLKKMDEYTENRTK